MKSAPGQASTQIIILIALLIGGGMVYYRNMQALKTNELASKADMGFKWNLYTLEGQTIPFANLKGKTIFLNFFGTRCAPCLYEIPAIQKMYEKVKGKGVEVVVMSSEDAATLSSFMASQPVTFPMYRFEPPIDIGTTKLDGIPATMIIAPNGKVVRAHIGPDAWDSDENVKFLLSLAKRYS